MNTSEKILSGKISLFSLAWPIFIQLLLSMLMGNMDSIMLSHYSDTSVAAVGNANVIMSLLIMTFNIVAIATNIIVSQYLGAKKYDDTSKIYSTSLFTNGAFSLALSLIIIMLHKPIFKLINTPKELMTDASNYLVIVTLFIFIEACNLTFSAIFRSNGMMKIPMMIAMGANLLNIIGNYLFLYGGLKFLDLGVKGVAISTISSRTMALIVMFILFKKNIQGNISIKYLRPFPVNIFKKILTIGVPTAGENISYNISQIIILSFVNTLGTAVVSARIYCNMMCFFSALYASAVAQATQLIVGYYIGAKREDDAYKRVFKTLIPAIFICVSIATINYLLCPFTFRLFTNDEEIIKICQNVMLINIFLEIGRSTNLIIISSLKASGDIRFPVYMGIASMWGIAALFSYVLGIHFALGLTGVWIAMALDEGFRAVLMLFRWKNGKWRGKSVVS